MKITCTVLLAFVGLASAVSKYDEYILTPKSRTLHPVAVYQDKVNGTVTGASSLASNSTGSAIFKGISAVTCDFGVNIGGLVSLTIMILVSRMRTVGPLGPQHSCLNI
jgi:hypothetical protein